MEDQNSNFTHLSDGSQMPSERLTSRPQEQIDDADEEEAELDREIAEVTNQLAERTASQKMGAQRWEQRWANNLSNNIEASPIAGNKLTTFFYNYRFEAVLGTLIGVLLILKKVFNFYAKSDEEENVVS